jgi:hypothetical protein
MAKQVVFTGECRKVAKKLCGARSSPLCTGSEICNVWEAARRAAKFAQASHLIPKEVNVYEKQPGESDRADCSFVGG